MPSASPLDHFSYCRFFTKVDRDWSQDQWRARDIVRAVKGETFGGSVWLTVGGVRRTLDKNHPEVAFEWFVEQVQLTTRFPLAGNYYLCPIPDSKCTVSSGRPSKTMRLAEALTKGIHKLAIWDGLRFTREMPKSRDSKMRDEEVLYQALITISAVPNGHIILLDDVCTTGAHARAAARRLLRGDKTSISSMSVARTMLNPDEQVLGLRVDKL
jgi:hypothetical protein